MPVGFKWFVPGLIDGSFGFGGEESAGASFLRRDGSTWTTDKDGLILDLLASEMLAVSGTTPSELYQQLVASHGDPAYARVDAPADREQKAKLARPLPRRRHRDRAGRREDHRQAHRGAGQRRRDRRAQGRHRERVVRRAAERHRGRLQDLRRVVPRPRPPRRGAGGRARGRLGRAGHMSDGQRSTALGLLDVLVGEWTQLVSGHGDPTGTITFEWSLGERYLLQRSTLPAPFPESLAIIEYDEAAGEFRQHYFDSRGVDPALPDDASRLGVDAAAHRGRLLRARLRPAFRRRPSPTTDVLSTGGGSSPTTVAQTWELDFGLRFERQP